MTAVPAPTSLRHPLVQGLLVLTFTTGLVDAVSYLGLGHVFAANMTGNVVLLAFGVAGAGGLPVVSPIIALVAFLIGAAAGGRLPLRAALGSEAALVAVATIVALTVDVRPNHFSGDTIIALLGLAMGARNAAVLRVNVPDLTTTVLTRTLTALAMHSPFGGGDGTGSTRRIAAVSAMFAGALAGALLLKTDIVLPLAGAALLALATWLTYGRARDGTH
jgi:uncharacterized membrane protein YoaK (UPF0700 family)